MNKKEFYTTAIKLIGAFFFFESAFIFISQFSIFIQPLFDDFSSWNIGYAVYILVPLFLSLVVIAKAPRLVRMLGLVGEDDSDSDIDLGKWEVKSVAELAIIIVGGFMITENLIPLIASCVTYFSELVSPPSDVIRFEDQNKYGIILYSIGVILGILILTNVSWCVEKITGKYER
jgi:hypothetical protein